MSDSEKYRILLVEDDAELASMVADFLEANGIAVEVEGNGTEAANRIPNESFDGLVLDIGLPGMDGISICKSVRSGFDGPILMLTARGNEIDEVVALEVGADDYMAKPVRPRALLARLRVHLKRSQGEANESSNTRIDIGRLSIDSSSRTMTIDGNSIKLTTAEFDLVWLLATNAGSVISREKMYEKLHGVEYDGVDRSIDLRVSRLRKKVGDDPNLPRLIKSIRGVGYLMATES
jgi:two-component system OmpR family response regulator/two-component system response regulator RstA